MKSVCIWLGMSAGYAISVYVGWVSPGVALAESVASGSALVFRGFLS